MVKFCDECYKKYVKADAENLELSKDPELCRGCGQYRAVVKGAKEFSMWGELLQKRRSAQKKK